MKPGPKGGTAPGNAIDGRAPRRFPLVLGQVTDAQPRHGADDPAVILEVADHPQHEFHGRGEIDADIGVAVLGENRRDKTDQAAVAIDQRAAGTAGIDDGIGLNEILDFVKAGSGAVDRRGDAASDREPQPELIADGANVISQCRFRSEGRHRQVDGGLDQGNVGHRVPADDFGG